MSFIRAFVDNNLAFAISLAPNDAFVAIQLAVGFALLGEAALAAELGGRALALNPLGPSWWFYYAALPHFVLRDYAGHRAWIANANHRD